ncbi:MAG TPA: DUF177 domain-containing protein [Anaeromyxobacteraceae bacterium]|nr:DUF177 domain-containing protein [Anaeromyxobacteraceae bacterium]
MRVNIDEIKEGGLRRSWDVPREDLDRMVSADGAGWRAHGQAHLEARLERIERRVRLEASGRVELDVACSRCLSALTMDLPVDFELTLVPSDEYEVGPGQARDGSKGRVAGSFEPEEAEEEAYTGKVVDLDPILREQLILALPGYPVCGETCRGLCTVCGTNLNERDCGCERKVPDPRWAALKDLKP